MRLLTFPVEAHEVLSPDSILPKINRFQDIATVRSKYESRHASNDEKPFATGVNLFQLVKIGDEWKVMTILWQEDAH